MIILKHGTVFNYESINREAMKKPHWTKRLPDPPVASVE